MRLLLVHPDDKSAALQHAERMMRETRQQQLDVRTSEHVERGFAYVCELNTDVDAAIKSALVNSADYVYYVEKAFKIEKDTP
jgi:hypothetical protein